MPSQTLQRELSASPLKPKVPIESKSENSLSFDVWKLLAEIKQILLDMLCSNRLAGGRRGHF
jgi:hypothetical protein